MGQVLNEFAYVICDKCEGDGLVIFNIHGQKITCPKCQGLGRVDWIENATKGNNNVIKLRKLDR